MTKLSANSSMNVMTTLLVHRVADALRAALGVHALVRRDERGDQPEDERLDLADDEVGQLAQRLEAGQVRARRAALQDHVEEVAAGHADHAHQAVEQHRDQHRGEHPGHHETLRSGRCRAPASRPAPRGSCGRRGRRRSPSRPRRR